MFNIVTNVFGRDFSNGTLANTTPLAIPMGGSPNPTTITLKSSAAGRLIELSTDGGVEYFTPVYDTTSATMPVVSITAPVTHVRLTGTAADTWRII